MDPNKKSLLMASLPASVTNQFLIRRSAYPSFVPQRKSRMEDNERLEFLGDAILAL